MAKIVAFSANEILDSRGIPTIETTAALDDGTVSSAAVPAGTSIGRYEAVELRDGDTSRYQGLGVLKAINNVVKVIAPKLVNCDPLNQNNIDKILNQLDGTPNKKNLGANAVLSVSLAVCRAAALSQKLPLFKYINKLLFNINLPTPIQQMPTPIFNLINGGKHGGGNLDFQEFHVIPATSKPYHEALMMGQTIYKTLGDVLTHRGAVHSLGDEGGYAPNLFTNSDALEITAEAIGQTPYRLAYDVFLGLDVAASFFKKGGSYQIKDREAPLSSQDLISYYQGLQSQYHLLTLEDPLEEDDWEGWRKLRETLADGTIIVGDDLIATNPERLKKAISEKAATAILVKPNQIGTLSEVLTVIKIAREGNFKVIISHRSGETNDTFVADLAVGVGADYVKFGAPARGERVAKYNRLLEIEKEISK